jgi:hypothetical protein
VKTDPDYLDALTLLEERSRETGVEALLAAGAAVLALGPAFGAMKEYARAAASWRAVRAARRELALRLAVIDTSEVSASGPPGGVLSGSPLCTSGGPDPETSPPPVVAADAREAEARELEGDG